RVAQLADLHAPPVIALAHAEGGQQQRRQFLIRRLKNRCRFAARKMVASEQAIGKVAEIGCSVIVLYREVHGLRLSSYQPPCNTRRRSPRRNRTQAGEIRVAPPTLATADFRGRFSYHTGAVGVQASNLNLPETLDYWRSAR